MDTIKAIKTRRTIRLFKQEAIGSEMLLELVSAGLCAPAAANRQPLEYIIVNDTEIKGKVFECLAWAGYVAAETQPPCR